MNPYLNELRLEAGIARIEDDPWLVVINKESNVIDPLIGLEKFAELIIQECIRLADDSQYKCRTFPVSVAIKEHFGVE